MKIFFTCIILLGNIIHIAAQTQTYDSYVRQGKQKMELQDYKKAIVDFTIALEIEPGIEAFIYRANAKKMLDDIDGAMNDYNDAIVLDPKNAVLFNNRGNLKDEAHQPALAIKDYDKAIELDADYINAYYNRGIAHYNIKDYEGAKEDFLKVIELNKEDGLAYIGLALTNYKLNDRDQACVNFLKAKQYGFQKADDYLKKYCNQ